MACSLVEFVERLTSSGLMTAAEPEAFKQSPSEARDDVESLIRELIQTGRRTRYQVQQIQ